MLQRGNQNDRPVHLPSCIWGPIQSLFSFSVWTGGETGTDSSAGTGSTGSSTGSTSGERIAGDPLPPTAGLNLLFARRILFSQVQVHFWFSDSNCFFNLSHFSITQRDNLVPIWNKPVNRKTDKIWNECEFIQYYAGHSLNGLFESWPGPNRFGYKRDLTGTGDTSRHDATDASFVSYTVFGGDNPSKIRAVCQTGLNTVVIFIWRKRTTFCPGLFLPPNLWNLIGCKWDPVHDVVPLPHIDMWSN